MNGDAYWLTRIAPVREALAYQDWSKLGRDYGINPYGQHKRVWQFFDLLRNASGQPTSFLFRAEVKEGLPVFYVLSKAMLQNTPRSGEWNPRSLPPPSKPGIGWPSSSASIR